MCVSSLSSNPMLYGLRTKKENVLWVNIWPKEGFEITFVSKARETPGDSSRRHQLSLPYDEESGTVRADLGLKTVGVGAEVLVFPHVPHRALP